MRDSEATNNVYSIIQAKTHAEEKSYLFETEGDILLMKDSFFVGLLFTHIVAEHGQRGGFDE